MRTVIKSLKGLARWLQETRPAASFLGFMVALSSAAIAYRLVDAITFLSSFECFTYLMATMVTNNYIDRDHDCKKGGKWTFAKDHEYLYKWFMIGFWVVEVAMLAILYRIDWRLAAFAAPRALTGVVYSYARKIPVLSAITVALISALFSITPAMRSHANHSMWMFVLSTGLALFGREQLLDYRDRVADRVDRWKMTIAVIASGYVAKSVARGAIIFSALVLLSMPLTSLPLPAAYSAMFCIILMAVAAFIVMGSAQKARAVLDLGMGAFLVTLVTSYWLLSYLPPIGSLDMMERINSLAILALSAWLVLGGRRYFIRLNQLIGENLDDGSEQVPFSKQSPLTWPGMYGLYWLTVFACRLVSGLQHPVPEVVAVMKESAQTATILVLWLIALVCSGVPHVCTKNRTLGHVVVERMLVGIIVGFFFAAISGRTGIPLWLVALSIPLVAITSPELHQLRDLLKGHGCVQGIVTGVAIHIGIRESLIGIMPAYLLVVAFYYIWYKFHDFGVYIPSDRIIGPVMRKHFRQAN